MLHIIPTDMLFLAVVTAEAARRRFGIRTSNACLSSSRHTEQLAAASISRDGRLNCTTTITPTSDLYHTAGNRL